MSHAKVRARERYGIDVGIQDFKSIQEQVEIGRAVKLAGRGRRTSVYLVTVQEKDAIVVYNRQKKFVITFLPLTWNERGPSR